MSKLIGSDSQQQQGGDNSTNIQTGGDTQIIINGPINTGLGASDVKVIARDVMKNEFAALSMQAKNEAILKVEEFINRLLDEIGQDDFCKFSKASIQIALRKAQCGYIESDGEKDIENALIEIMKERIQSDDTIDYKKILTGALEVVPSLTSSQISFLSFYWMLAYTHRTYSDSKERVRDYIVDSILPFYLEEFLEEDFYDFIQYSNVLKHFDNPMSVCILKNVFAVEYQYVFSGGFLEKDAKNIFGDIYNDISEIFTSCGYGKIKFKPSSMTEIKEYLMRKNISDKYSDKCRKLIIESVDMESLKEFLLSIDDKFSKFILKWENLPCQYYQFSKLGIAIAYINCRMNGIVFDEPSIQKTLRMIK